MDSGPQGRKRKGGSAAKYDPIKRAQQSDPRRTRLHVNDPKDLRNYAMVACTYEGNEGSATIEMHRLFQQYLEEVYPEEEAAEVGGAKVCAEVVKGGSAKAAESETGPAAAAVASTAMAAPLTAADLLRQELAELGGGSGGSDDEGGDTGGAGKGAGNGCGEDGGGAPKQKPPTARDAKLMTVRTNCKGVVMLRVGTPYRLDASATIPNSSATDAAATSAAATRAPTPNTVASGSTKGPLVDPLRVVRAIFGAVEASGQPVSRHLVRLVPLQRTCFAGKAEVLASIAPLLAERLAPAPGRAPTTFNVVVKRRNATHFDKDGLIDAVVDAVNALGGGHTVWVTRRSPAPRARREHAAAHTARRDTRRALLAGLHVNSDLSPPFRTPLPSSPPIFTVTLLHHAAFAFRHVAGLPCRCRCGARR